MGGIRIVFRGKQAMVSEGFSPDMPYECWMDGAKIVLYKAGGTTIYDTILVNNDGTLQTELAELKKKGN
jgi:hypothetical protein